MNISRSTTHRFLIIFLSATFLASAAQAQTLPGEAGGPPPTSDTQVHPSAAPSVEQPVAQPGITAEETAGNWTVRVRVQHATDDDAYLSGLPVFIHALPPRGPFQSGDPQPAATWTSSTNAEGIAEFSSIPEDIAQRGLRLQASASFEGISFDSSQSAPADELQLDLTVYDQGQDLSGLRVSEKRIVVEPWEEYLIISQFWTFELHGEHAVDISLSSDPALQRGLPIRLPVQAEGINFSGPGEHEVINNVIFWNGVLQPNRPVAVQIRFSQSIRASEFTYEQIMEFPVDQLQIVAPIQTQYNKIPRLNELALLAPGFTVEADASSLGLRSDMEFLIATGGDIEAGEMYTFRLEGLPFRRPFGGWVALIGGFLAAIFILGYGRREYKNLHDGKSRQQLLDALHQQRSAVLDELAELRLELIETYGEEELFELEEEEAMLRERLALILRRIRDLESGNSSL